MQTRSSWEHEEGEDGHGWDHAGWSYDGPTGPQYWGTLTPDYAQCSSGTSVRPRPINSPLTNLSDFKKNDSSASFATGGRQSPIDIIEFRTSRR
jgi:carbonic anhydrase